MKRLTRWLQPYRVVAVDGSLGVWHRWTHRAWTLQDALEWARCYPADATIIITTRTGRIVAARGV